MNAIFSMQGIQDLLEVFEDRLTITPKGFRGLINKGLKGTKEIPFNSITAIQFKEARPLFNGYIQFTIPGGIENKGGIFGATKDENTFMFAGKINNAQVIEIKNYIDSAIRKMRAPQSTSPMTSLSDELQKLSGLKEQGILSEEEFLAAKKKLLG